MRKRLANAGVAWIFVMAATVASQHLVANAATPPPFDTSFGTNGMVELRVPLQRSNYLSTKIMNDSDGKILSLSLVDGMTFNRKAIVARFTSTGNPDSTFGTNGRAILEKIDSANMALQPDGKIVVVGISYTHLQSTLIVQRLTASGVIDEEFGENGKYILSETPGRNFGSSTPTIAVSQNNIFVGFEYQLDVSNVGFHFVALNQYGYTDINWGSSGGRYIIPRNSGASAWSTLNSIQALGDGSLLALGSVYTNGVGRQIILVKYTSSGNLDTSFDGTTSGNGVVKLSFPGKDDSFMTAIKVLSGGEIVLAGFAGAYFYGPWNYGFAKLTDSGAPDSTFGASSNGFALSSLTTDGGFTSDSLAQQTNGKLLYPVNNTAGTSAGVLRVDANGTFPSSECSVCLWPTPPQVITAKSVLAQSDGNIVVGGDGNIGSDGKGGVLFRFLGDGTFDSSFNSAVNVFSYVRLQTYAIKSVPLSDGSILTLASANIVNVWDSSYSIVFKLTPTGALDQTFGQGGYTILNSEPKDLVVRPNGKIVVSANTSDGNILMSQLNADGTRDNTFGANGQTITDDPNEPIYSGRLILMSTGHILMSVQRSGMNSLPWIYKYQSDGTLDPSFTDSNSFAGGIQLVPGDYGEARIYGSGSDISYIAGYTSNNSETSTYIARLLPNGTLDLTFGGNNSGYISWPSSGQNAISWIDDVIVGANGNITILGWQNQPASSQVVAQFLPNGTPSSSFNGTGRTLFNMRAADGISQRANSMIATDSGFFVAGGGGPAESYDDNYFGVAKFLPSGAIDQSFGSNGFVFSDDSMSTQFVHIARMSSSTNILTGYVMDNQTTVGLVMKMNTTMPATTTSSSTTTSTTSTTLAPPVTESDSGEDIKLVVSTTQSAILKKMKLTVPKGGKVSMKSTTAKVCRVSGTKVIAYSPGTCRISITLTVKGKKSTKTFTTKVK